MNDHQVYALVLAAVSFIILAGGGVGALIISFFSQRAHITRLNQALATAMTALRREFTIPDSQVAELAEAVSSKITYSGVKH